MSPPQRPKKRNPRLNKRFQNMCPLRLTIQRGEYRVDDLAVGREQMCKSEFRLHHNGLFVREGHKANFAGIATRTARTYSAKG